MSADDKMLGRKEPVFRIGNIVCVPHYVTPYRFVLPGGVTKSLQQLAACGAVRSFEYLWARTWTDSVIQQWEMEGVK